MVYVEEFKVFSINMMNLSRGMGRLARLHFRMSSPWDAGLATHADFLPWVENITHENMDDAAGGAFLSLTIAQAIALVEKMVSNQGWNEERL